MWTTISIGMQDSCEEIYMHVVRVGRVCRRTMNHSLLPEFVKNANVVATSRSEINLCEPTERKSKIVYARFHKRK